MAELLTDQQCDEFRRFPGSFNDMVRHIYEAGMAEMLVRSQLIPKQPPAAFPWEFPITRP